MGKSLLSFTIEGKLPGLNEYTLVNRNNRFGGSKLKRDTETLVKRFLPSKSIKKYPVLIDIVWYEPNNRRDVDNVTFAVKFILDAMVKSDILVNDSRKYIRKINHEVLTDKENPRIEVTVLSLD